MEAFEKKREYFKSLPRIKLNTAKEFNVYWKCPHLRAQDASLKGACAAKCSKFDLEKFENSIIPLEGACAQCGVIGYIELYFYENVL